MTAATHRAYEGLLRRIQSGELVSGDFLIESELASAIGVSRTPVREAIRRLAAEGLVRTEGHRRAVVREFDDARVIELYEIRSRLEAYAAERAATRIDAAQLAAMRELDRQMHDCATTMKRSGAEQTARFADLNDRFHQLILQAADAPHLESALRPVLQIQLVMLQRYRQSIVEHLERSCWHHRELIRAFELRDPQLAAEQMRLHMLAARNARTGPKESS